MPAEKTTQKLRVWDSPASLALDIKKADESRLGLLLRNLPLTLAGAVAEEEAGAVPLPPGGLEAARPLHPEVAEGAAACPAQGPPSRAEEPEVGLG